MNTTYLKRMKTIQTLFFASLMVLFGACSSDTPALDETPDIGSIETTLGQDEIGTCVMDVSPAFRYNAFILNDVSLGSGDSEGPIALGGNLVINGAFTVAAHEAGSLFDGNDDLAASLVVGGSVIYETTEGIKVNHGNIKVGDLTGSVVHDFDNNNVATNTRITPGDFQQTPRILSQRHQLFESIAVSGLIEFDSAFATIRDASLRASTLENNVTIAENNKITLANGLNVLNITGAELNNLVDFTFNNQPTIDSPLLVNVSTEENFVWTVQNQAGIGDQQGAFIAYNFFNAEQINIVSGTSIMGSLIAP